MAQGSGHLHPKQQLVLSGEPLLVEPPRNHQHGGATAAIPLQQRQGVEAVAAGLDRRAQ